MLSIHQSYHKESQNHSLSHIPQVDNKVTSTVHLHVPRLSHLELIEKRTSINEIEDLSQAKQTNGSKKITLTKKQKIIIAVTLFLAISGLVGGLVAYKIISDNNDSDDSVPQIPSTYPTYQQKIIVGQENNLIQLINVPNTQRIYNYTLTNYRTLYNVDNQTEVVALPSNYKFGLVCLDVTEKDFDMILYFIESTIPVSQNYTVKFSDYPLTEDYMYNNIPKVQQSTVGSQDNNDHQNFNELSSLNEEEIALLKSKNIDPEDFLKSNLPIIRFKVLKTGQIGSIEKPMNMRFDLQQVLINILEQISPVVLKDYYSTFQQHNNGNRRMLKKNTQRYSRRVLNNQNVPLNLEAVVDSHLSAKLDKSYEDVQLTENTKHKTSYNQVNTFQNGALQTSQILSTVALTSQQDPNAPEEDKQIFKTMLVDSEGQIKFVSQQDKVDSQFLSQLTQDQSEMLKLKLTWEEAIELQNKVQKYDSEKSASSNAGRLLQTVSDEKIVGKEIKASIFKNAYASIDFGADFYSGCVDVTSQKNVRCSASFIGNFHKNSKKIFEQNLTKSYTEGSSDKIGKQLNYVKNNVFNLMGNVRSKVSNKIDASIDLLDSLILRNTQFQSKVAQPIIDQLVSDKQNLTNNLNTFNAYISNYTDYMVDFTKDMVGRYNTSMEALIIQYGDVSNKTLNAITSLYNDRITRFRALLKQIIDSKNTVSQPTYQSIQTVVVNEYVRFQQIYNSSAYDIGLMPQKYLSVCSALDASYNSMIYGLQDIYTPIWEQVQAQNPNVPVDLQLKKYYINYTMTYFRSSVVSNYFCEPYTNFYSRTLVSRNTITAYSTANSASAKAAADLDYQNASKISFTTSPINDPYQDEAAALASELMSFFDVTSVYADFVKKSLDDIVLFQAEGSALIQQSTDIVKDFFITAAKFAIDSPSSFMQVERNFIQKYNEQQALVEKEYQDQTTLVNESSAQIASNVDSLYNDVITFLNNKNYPEVDPLNDQTPPADALFNDIVFGITDEYLTSQLTKLSDKLTQVHTLVDSLSVINPQIKTQVDDVSAFVTAFMVTIPTRPEAKFNSRYIVLLFKKLFGYFSAAFQTDTNNILTTTPFDATKVVALPSFYSKIDSFVNTDMQVTFKTAINTSQSNMAQLYNQVITDISNQVPTSTGKSFGDKNVLNNENHPIFVRVNYTYVYPTPVGISIKLNLYANWTAGMQTALTTEKETLKFESLTSIKVQVKGVFSALIATTEIGGYADGKFVDASLKSSISANINNNTGVNTLEAKYGPTHIRIGQYMLIYVPKVVTDCSSKEIIFKPSDNNGIKSSVISTIAAGIQAITGCLPKSTKCQTIITSTAIKTNLFQPIEANGKTYTKVLVNESY